MRPSTIGPRLGRVGTVALLAVCAAVVAVSAAQAGDIAHDTQVQASDFAWSTPGADTIPSDFAWS